MDPHDVAGVLAKPLSQELLGSSIPARLAYLGTDDAPRVIPIAFVWAGEHVLMATAPKAARSAHCGSTQRSCCCSASASWRVQT
jgi:hypothetical protein